MVIKLFIFFFSSVQLALNACCFALWGSILQPSGQPLLLMQWIFILHFSNYNYIPKLKYMEYTLILSYQCYSSLP